MATLYQLIITATIANRAIHYLSLPIPYIIKISHHTNLLSLTRHYGNLLSFIITKVSLSLTSFGLFKYLTINWI